MEPKAGLADIVQGYDRESISQLFLSSAAQVGGIMHCGNSVELLSARCEL